ncbi:MAG: hypothetical protein Q8R37_05105 [Nanoarchaeota archaeon]|nr:hypothetical protein [Nanoarchaeota archaeon]
MKTVHHLSKKWEVSIIEFQLDSSKEYKVTRRIPELNVSETKIFRSKTKAKQQFEKWLE